MSQLKASKSCNHEIIYNGSNVWYIRWSVDYVDSNGLTVQTIRRRQLTTLKGATRFAKKWGLEAPEPPKSKWVIIKRGLFYRPNKKGYTACLINAGIYTQEEAEREAKIQPNIITAVPYDAMCTN